MFHYVVLPAASDSRDMIFLFIFNSVCVCFVYNGIGIRKRERERVGKANEVKKGVRERERERIAYLGTIKGWFCVSFVNLRFWDNFFPFHSSHILPLHAVSDLLLV